MSFKEIFHTLDDFTTASGLKINEEQKQRSLVGIQDRHTKTTMPRHQYTWNTDTFKILGIMFSLQQSEIPKLNYDKQLNIARKTLFAWSK